MPLGGCQPLQPARRAATIARDVDSRSAAISDAAAATLVAPAILPVSIVLLQRWADGRGNHLETRHKSNQSHMPCPAFTLSRPVKCRGTDCGWHGETSIYPPEELPAVAPDAGRPSETAASAVASCAPASARHGGPQWPGTLANPFKAVCEGQSAAGRSG